jgi:hypothetical protein
MADSGVDVYFGTVVRGAPFREGGALLRLDWDRGEVVADSAVYIRDIDSDPNPRGHSRGCRGIAIAGDTVYACNYHTICVYDRELTCHSELSNGLMLGLHEVFLDGESMWVTSTPIDAAIQVSLADASILDSCWPREHPLLQRTLKLTPPELDKAADNRLLFFAESAKRPVAHLHLNAVLPWADRVLALFNTKGMVVDLRTAETLVSDSALTGGHNLVAVDDCHFASCGTLNQTVRIYEAATGRLADVIDLRTFEWVRELEKRAERHLSRLESVARALGKSLAKMLFVRGLWCHGEWLFVGVAPASILRIHWPSGQFMDAFCYSENPRVAVHGLCAAERC